MKNIKPLLFIIFLMLASTAYSSSPSQITDWSTQDYSEAMINSGSIEGEGQPYQFGNLFIRTQEEGGVDYTYFYFQLSDEEILQIDGSQESSIKSAIYFTKGGGSAAIAQAGEENFIYIRDSDNRIIGFEVKVPLTDLNLTYDEVNDVYKDSNGNVVDIESTSYYTEFEAKSNVILNDGNGPLNDDTYSTKNCSGDCPDDVICVTENCSPGGGSDPEIPIDGGLSILAFFGIAFGVYNQRKK